MIPEKEKMIALLTALFPNAKIYLFGSYARGTQRETSDIDIAIDAGRKLSYLDLGTAKNVLAALYIPQKIDIVDMQRIPEEMKKIILKEGIVWKA